MALGDIWTVLRSKSAAADWMREVAYDATLDAFISVGGEIAPGEAKFWRALPADLTTWTEEQSSVGASLLGVGASGSGELVAVGFNGQIWRSTNGTSWVSDIQAGAPEINRTSYGPTLSPSQNLFLQVGPDSVYQQDTPSSATFSLITTATGLTDLQAIDVNPSSALWTCVGGTAGGGPMEVAYRAGGTGGAYTRYTVTGEKGWSLSFGNGAWCAGADGGDIHRATDPTAGAGNWSTISTSSTSRVQNILYLRDSIWCACTLAGEILMSFDNGLSWLDRSTPVTDALSGIAYDQSREQLIVVGEDGLVIGSDETSSAVPPFGPEPTATEPLAAGDDVSQAAIDRLAQQFRG